MLSVSIRHKQENPLHQTEEKQKRHHDEQIGNSVQGDQQLVHGF
jgi:hypothetical protein